VARSRAPSALIHRADPATPDYLSRFGAHGGHYSGPCEPGNATRIRYLEQPGGPTGSVNGRIDANCEASPTAPAPLAPRWGRSLLNNTAGRARPDSARIVGLQAVGRHHPFEGIQREQKWWHNLVMSGTEHTPTCLATITAQSVALICDENASSAPAFLLEWKGARDGPFLAT
jgi:hypothetical protein